MKCLASRDPGVPAKDGTPGSQLARPSLVVVYCCCTGCVDQTHDHVGRVRSPTSAYIGMVRPEFTKAKSRSRSWLTIPTTQVAGNQANVSFAPCVSCEDSGAIGWNAQRPCQSYRGRSGTMSKAEPESRKAKKSVLSAEL